MNNLNPALPVHLLTIACATSELVAESFPTEAQLQEKILLYKFNGTHMVEKIFHNFAIAQHYYVADQEVNNLLSSI